MRHSSGWSVVGLLAAASIAAGCLLASSTPRDSRTVDVPLGLLPLGSHLNTQRDSLRVTLGERLFMERGLSGDGQRSCATCHIPARAFTEPRAVALTPGGSPASRNTPTVLNISYTTLLMWDGSVGSLEEQAVHSFLDEREMASSLESILRWVESDPSYVREFYRAFGARPSKDLVARALAEYQRSLLSGNAPFDRYVYSRDSSALSVSQRRGLDVFLKVNCILCHEFFDPSVHPLGGREALFTDGRFHNLGVGWSDGRMQDVGRYLVSQKPEDWGAFRTPTLRNVAVTAPYMHDGSLATLRDVIEFYNEGGRPNLNLDAAIVPLSLTDEEIDDLVAFLHALTSPEYQGHPSP
jgi:cytochrome c peroxidase